MISSIILIGLAAFATATAPPSGSPSASWRVGNDAGSYRRNEDIPIMGDHSSRRRSKDSGSKNKKRRRHSKTRKVDTCDTSDDGDDPPFFFLDQGYDNDQWDDQYEYERQRRRRQRNQTNNNQPLDSIRRWALDKTGVHIPRVNLHFDPVTILKIRKSWHNAVPGAIVRVGADLETHRLGRGVWRLRGCIEDKLIGGRFTMKQRKITGDDRAVLMEYSKSWLFAGAGSIGTRFNLSAAYDLTTHRGSARFGFKAENTDAVGSYQIMPGRKGFSIVPIIPLDIDRRLLLEAKTNIDLPEPEFVIGTDFASADDASLGMGIGGDIDVEVEEVNLIFSF
ncbi:hypothetical protein ACHAXR_011339 [Thalassiosira sp. AJA248-18]